MEMESQVLAHNRVSDPKVSRADMMMFVHNHNLTLHRFHATLQQQQKTSDVWDLCEVMH